MKDQPKPFSLRLEEEVMLMVKRQAEENKRSLNQELSTIIEESFSNSPTISEVLERISILERNQEHLIKLIESLKER